MLCFACVAPSCDELASYDSTDFVKECGVVFKLFFKFLRIRQLPTGGRFFFVVVNGLLF